MKAELPKSWISAPLGDVCKTLKGKKPKNSGKISEDRTIPYINIKAFETGIPFEYAEPGNYPECSKNDVLIVWDGARSGLTGRGVAGYIGSTLSKIWSDIIENGYLFYFLQSQYDYINTNTKGVGIPHVDPTILFAIELPISPLNEQKRIVAEIEKQFSRLDEAVKNLKHVKANLKRYKDSVLKAAVEGKLTERWRAKHPDVEPASELLKRILTERRKKWEEAELAKMKAKGKEPKDDKWKKKYKEPGSSDSIGLRLPDDWVWTTIGQVFNVYIGATPSRSKTEYWNGDIPWVSSGEVAFCKIKSTRETITKLGFKNSSTKLHPPGTILLGMIGEGKTRGQAAILNIEACNNQNSAAIRVPGTEILPEYLYHFLVEQYEKIRTRGSGGNQPALNKSRVQQIPFPLPPLLEQKAIISEIERLLSNIENFTAISDANMVRADRLRQSILKKAFSGKLVSQNNNDEFVGDPLKRSA